LIYRVVPPPELPAPESIRDLESVSQGMQAHVEGQGNRGST